MHFGTPVVPDEYRMKSGMIERQRSNSMSAGA
jgi:hypothetical protein